MYPGKHETSIQCWTSAVDGGPTLNECWVNFRLLAGLVIRHFHSMYRSCKQETHIKNWFNIGTDIGSTSCLYGLNIS